MLLSALFPMLSGYVNQKAVFVVSFGTTYYFLDLLVMQKVSSGLYFVSLVRQMV